MIAFIVKEKKVGDNDTTQFTCEDFYYLSNVCFLLLYIH